LSNAEEIILSLHFGARVESDSTTCRFGSCLLSLAERILVAYLSETIEALTLQLVILLGSGIGSCHIGVLPSKLICLSLLSWHRKLTLIVKLVLGCGELINWVLLI
jgi:hypothetical protein